MSRNKFIQTFLFKFNFPYVYNLKATALAFWRRVLNAQRSYPNTNDSDWNYLCSLFAYTNDANSLPWILHFVCEFRWGEIQFEVCLQWLRSAMYQTVICISLGAGAIRAIISPNDIAAHEYTPMPLNKFTARHTFRNGSN